MTSHEHRVGWPGPDCRALVAVPDVQKPNAQEGRDKAGRAEEPQRRAFGTLGSNGRRPGKHALGSERRGGRAGRFCRLGRSRRLARLQAEGLAAMRTEVALAGLPVANREGFAAPRAGKREVSHVRSPSRGNYLSLSQRTIVLVTTGAASCCTKCPACGMVTSVSWLSIQFQVSFRAPGKRAVSFKP